MLRSSGQKSNVEVDIGLFGYLFRDRVGYSNVSEMERCCKNDGRIVFGSLWSGNGPILRVCFGKNTGDGGIEVDGGARASEELLKDLEVSSRNPCSSGCCK